MRLRTERVLSPRDDGVSLTALGRHKPPRNRAIKAYWTSEAKAHLKRELATANVKYAELARRLTEMGLPETEGSVGAKIHRGTFSAWFLLAALGVIGAQTLQLD